MATLSELNPSAVKSNALRGGRLSLSQRRNIVGYLFISPFILGFLFWFLIPAAVAFYLVFQKWNLITRGLGLGKIRWLQEPSLALTSLMIITLWSVGGSMIIFLAGLQGIPEMYYEAAEIDGANRWNKLVDITLPLMSPIIFFNLI